MARACRRPPSRPRRGRGRRARWTWCELHRSRRAPASRRHESSSSRRDSPACEPVLRGGLRRGGRAPTCSSPSDVARGLGSRVEVDPRADASRPAAIEREAVGRAGNGGRTSSRRPARRAARGARGSAVGVRSLRPARPPDRAAASRADPRGRSARSATTSAVAADDQRVDAERQPDACPEAPQRRRTSAIVGRTRNSQRAKTSPPHDGSAARWRSSRTPAAAGERPQLVPNLLEGADRLLLHRRVDVVVRELSLREQPRQAARRRRRQLRGRRGRAPRYSSGVSDGRRATPSAARTLSMRAYAAMIARRDPPRRGGRRARRPERPRAPRASSSRGSRARRRASLETTYAMTATPTSAIDRGDRSQLTLGSYS